jgi:hypothetical protein
MDEKSRLTAYRSPASFTRSRLQAGTEFLCFTFQKMNLKLFWGIERNQYVRVKATLAKRPDIQYCFQVF